VGIPSAARLDGRRRGDETESEARRSVGRSHSFWRSRSSDGDFQERSGVPRYRRAREHPSALRRTGEERAQRFLEELRAVLPWRPW